MRKYTRSELTAQIPAYYRWWIHLPLLAASVVGFGALFWSQLVPLTVGEWIAVPITFVALNGFEYWIHRLPFHVRMVTGRTYRLHTTVHHNFFHHDRMPIDDFREIKWVSFPAWGFMAIIIGGVPIAFGLSVVVSANMAWLFLLAVAIYFFVYETFHILAHLPARHVLVRNRVVQAASRHHRIHHNPALMKRYNFNFAVPLFDWVFGTHFSDDRLSQRLLGNREYPAVKEHRHMADVVD